jgi:hypothetical protein
MKILKSILIVISLVTLNPIVNAGNNTDLSTKDLREKVKQSISTPESIKERHRSQKITVYFTVNGNGQVIEANAKTQDKKAKEDLEKQFLRLTFEGLKPCVRNSIDINFLML